MIIKATVKGEEIEIDIPESDYWIKRNKQRVTPYWNKADNLEKRMNKEFIKAYKQLEKEFFAFANKFGTDGKLKYSQTRIIALMKEIKPHIDNLYDSHQVTLTDLLSEVYEDNYLKGMYELTIGTKVAYSFVGLDERAIKTAISYPWSGANFSDRIYNNKNKLITTLKQEITQSIIRGDTPDKTIKSVSKRLDISRKNAGRLVQTETSAVISSSDKKMYDEFEVEKYEYVATLDNRTSDICKSLDGKVFNVKDYQPGVNAPVMHPNERSTTVAYFDDIVGERIARNLNTGKAEYISGEVDYKTWRETYEK